MPGPYWCIRSHYSRAWKKILYRLPPRKDYHVYIARTEYLSLRIRTSDASQLEKKNKEKKRRERKGKKRKESEKGKERKDKKSKKGQDKKRKQGKEKRKAQEERDGLVYHTEKAKATV